MQFEMPKEKSSIIKVLGIGGGGNNAVNNMYEQGIQGVNFVICNTDNQALESSPIPNKIQLGPNLTEGRGAGSKPEIGREATEESVDTIKELLEVNTKMAFITAGMGGGTGTGGAPVLAKICKEMGILTVGIVTEPFRFEGRRRQDQARKGIEELRKNVDTLIVICNEKLRKVYGNQTLTDAFKKADDVLATAAKGIAEIITVPGYVNVDFEDVKTVMTGSGVAIMGSATAEGEHRAMLAAEAALSSPLLSDNDISGAKNILLNITSGTSEVLMDEIDVITDYLQSQAGNDTDIIWGNCQDESLGESISVTVIATGFEAYQEWKKEQKENNRKVVHDLEDGEQNEAVEQPSMDVESAEEEEEDPANQYTFDFELKDKRPVQDHQIEEKQEAYDRNTRQQSQAQPADPSPSPEQNESDREEAVDISFSHNSAENKDDAVDDDQQMRRIRKLRKMSLKFNNPEKLRELEDEPAYVRRQIELDDVPHSSDHDISRLSLNENEKDEGSDDDEDRIQLRKNNSYLHDSVD